MFYVMNVQMQYLWFVLFVSTTEDWFATMWLVGCCQQIIITMVPICERIGICGTELCFGIFSEKGALLTRERQLRLDGGICRHHNEKRNPRWFRFESQSKSATTFLLPKNQRATNSEQVSRSGWSAATFSHDHSIKRISTIRIAVGDARFPGRVSLSSFEY
jgi:hypothetical protein